MGFVELHTDYVWRTAQVETLLKGVNDATKEAPVEHLPPQVSVELEDEEIGFSTHGTTRPASEDLSPHEQVPFTQPGLGQPDKLSSAEDWQLMELGLTEAPPPWEVIEEL